jgi:hypothetical protein
MLILVAIGTEVFPVAAVWRVVGRIPVFVMDGQKVEVGSVELAGALGANPAMKRQGAFTIAGRFIRLDVLDELLDIIALNISLERTSSASTFSKSGA